MKWFSSFCYCLWTCLIITMPTLHSTEESFNKKPVESVFLWSQGSQHFTAGFYPYAKSGEDNFIFSPISLQLALAMTAELALGSTQIEILEKAFIPTEKELRLEGVELILNQINTHLLNEDEFNCLSLANSAWLASDIHFPLHLKTLLTHSYKALFKEAHFKLFPEETRKEINAWVEENTSHQIQHLLPKGAIDKQTKLVLVNTLYMRAPWEKPFNPEITYEALFHGFKQSPSLASYMRQKATLGFLDEANCSVIELPFQPSDFSQTSLSLFIVLPHEEFSLEQVEQELTPDCFDRWIHGITPHSLDLSLPKFKIASCLNASTILQHMGIQQVFSDRAQFDKGIRNGKLAITNIVHQAVFEVDEWGGTGSAGTAVIIGVTSIQKKPLEVIINRPFLLFVADKTTGMVLFVGHIIHPKS